MENSSDLKKGAPEKQCPQEHGGLPRWEPDSIGYASAGNESVGSLNQEIESQNAK